MYSGKNVLIIDDDPVFRLMLDTFLKRQKFTTFTAGASSEAIRVFNKEKLDLILVDLRLPDKNGIDLLKEIKEKNSSLPIILMTSFVDIRTAVKAIKSGAFEYITKPINTDELMLAVEMALKNRYTKTDPSVHVSNYIEGLSSHSKEIIKNVNLVASTNLSVLITGESGTGKEYVARKIHNESKRSDKPFVAIDCGVLSSELAASELFGHLKGAFTGALFDKTGHFETADNGTIFLDEIGNLNLDVQVMLLRAIQEKQVRRIGSTKTLPIDVRIIAATNEDLKEAISKGIFREDLYHRLNEFSIHVPSLRERNEDIELFISVFLEEANQELNKIVKGFDQNALSIIKSYAWPGNLRELKNIVKRSVLLSPDMEMITREILPSELSSVNINKGGLNSKENFDLKAAAFKQEKDYIVTVLEKVKFNKSSAAKILNIDRKTLYNKLKQYGIEL